MAPDMAKLQSNGAFAWTGLSEPIAFLALVLACLVCYYFLLHHSILASGNLRVLFRKIRWN